MNEYLKYSITQKYMNDKEIDTFFNSQFITAIMRLRWLGHLQRMRRTDKGRWPIPK